MTDETMLRAWRWDHIALLDVVAAAGDFVGTEIAVAFLSERRWHRVARIVGKQVRASDGDDAPLNLAGVFEARFFTLKWELRWRCDADDPLGRGSAVLLSESIDPPSEPWFAVTSVSAIATQEFQYIVAATIGRRSDIARPLSRANEHKVQALRVKEYFAREPQFGNAYVAEERLMALETISSAELATEVTTNVIH
jgi:hypothetical protein